MRRIIVLKALFLWFLLVYGGSVAQAVAETESTAATVTRLKYAATIAGLPAGWVRVTLHRSEVAYQIEGRAEAEGLLQALSPWRSEFSGNGLIRDGRPVARHYSYVERGRDKRRQVRVEAQKLFETKNGKVRPEREALPGLDVLAALFVEPRCAPALRVHTGRQGYRLDRVLDEVSSGAAVGSRQHCRFQVTDEDQDRHILVVELTRLDGRMLPNVLRIQGPVNGVLTLIAQSVASLHCDAASSNRSGPVCGR